MAIFQLDDNLWFPSPYLGETDGLVAVGGDLSPERLLLAYSNGFFPWFSFRDNDEPLWYCPLQRFVIFPDEIHISHSMRNLINRGKYECTVNRAFGEVIRNCSEADGRFGKEGAWLGPDIIEAYTEMHRRGAAVSLEVWEKIEQNGDSQCVLAGGLYGIQLGRGFMGESMFSRMPNASKFALICLARLCMKMGWNLIDCQFETPHLKSMGGRHIPYDEYMRLLE